MFARCNRLQLTLLPTLAHLHAFLTRMFYSHDSMLECADCIHMPPCAQRSNCSPEWLNDKIISFSLEMFTRRDFAALEGVSIERLHARLHFVF